MNASDITNQLSDFFCKEYALDKNNIKVIIHTALHTKKHCDNPIFFVSNQAHYFGLIDVLLNCDKIATHLQTELQVTGEYVVADKFIPKDTQIRSSDLKIVRGRLDILPYQTYLRKKDIVEKVVLNNIFPSQTITSLMVHPAWLVKTNQSVSVILQGLDFKIILQGIALRNAMQNQISLVRIYNNKILTGIVNQNSAIVIHM